MIISRTPLRISFLGGGSDLPSYYQHARYGAVLSTTINKYIYITVNQKFDDLIRLSYSKTEIVETVDQIEHNIIREALKIVGIEKGIEIVYMGDIPLGSAGVGLGSSSCLAVGVLNALYAYTGKHVSAEQLAQEACDIEINRLMNPIGKQDQYAAGYGGFSWIQFNNDDSVFIDPIICSKQTKNNLRDNLLVFYTGIQRISSDILSEQNKKSQTNLTFLNQMVKLAEESRRCMETNHLNTFGELLHEGWLLKKQLASTISNSIIDEYYDLARQAGAIGGKLLGAGGGGFLMLYCEKDKQHTVRNALKHLKEYFIDFEPQGSKIIYIHD